MGMGLDFNMCPSYRLVDSSLSLDMGIFFFFFFVDSNILLLMLVQQLVAIFSQEMSAHLSTLLFWRPHHVNG